MRSQTADDVRKANMFTLATTHALYIESIRALMGDRGLREVAEFNRRHGLRLGQNGIQEGSLKKAQLSSIFDFFESAHPYFGFELEKAVDEPDRLDIKVTFCPWIDGFKSLDAAPDICHWVTKIDEGIGQAVDENVRMELIKCMMRGDSHCIYSFRRGNVE